MKDYKFFFATDIHGSDLCLKKFLNSGKFYDVDAIIMGGDITGKMRKNSLIMLMVHKMQPNFKTKKQ